MDVCTYSAEVEKQDVRLRLLPALNPEHSIFLPPLIAEIRL
jgi:hypothetical protein